MAIAFSRHARRQMKWRKISEQEAQEAVLHPDVLVDTTRGRKNAFKTFKGRVLRITYAPRNGDITVITAVAK